MTDDNRLSLNARQSFNSSDSTQVPIILIDITNPMTAEHHLLSSDPTHILSNDPRKYGTKSLWGALISGMKRNFEFVLMEALRPDDTDGSPATVPIALANVSAALTKEMRSITEPTPMVMAMVLSGTPDIVELQYDFYSLRSVEYDGAQITLKISQTTITDEPCPQHRMTRHRFPGLFE